MTTGVQVQIGADIGQLRNGLAQAGNEMRRFGERITASFAGLRNALGNVGNIVAAVGAVKLTALADDAALLSARLKDVTGSASAAAQAQAQLFSIAQDLQVGYSDLSSSFARMMPAVKALGGGITEASRLAEILATTARLSGASSAEAASSAVQFAQALGSGVLQGDELRSILENNQALARTLADALGVTVGELKKLGAEGKLTSDIVANALLGRYDEIKQRSAELPQTVGGAWARITNEFQRFIGSVNDGSSVFSGLTSILNEVARFLAALTQSFRTTGDEARRLGTDSTVATWARTIMETFAGVIDLASLVKQAFVSVGKDIGAVAAAIVQAVQGNFSTAYNILKQRSQDLAAESQRMRELWNGSGSSMLGALRGQSGSNAAGGRGPSARLKSGTTPTEGATKPKGKTEADPSFMAYYEAALDQERRLEAEKDALRELSKQKELAYWQNILQFAQLSTQDRLAITRKVADLEVAIRRESSLQGLALDREEARAREELALGAIETRRAANKLALDDERISKQQFIAAELEFQAQIYTIQAAALAERMKLAERDPSTSPAERARLQNEQLSLEQRFQAERMNILGGLSQGKALVGRDQSDQLFSGMANSFGTSLESMLVQARTWQDAMRTLWNGLASVFVRVMVTQPLGDWVAAQAKMLAVKMGFVEASGAADAAAASKSVATNAAAASAIVGAEGAKAGAGAAASQASIPIVGPGLAIAAMFATLAAVLALRKNIKSAAGGYDIPAGVNPMVQLHEEEMVLPRDLATRVRAMTAGSGGDTELTSSRPVNLHVHATDAPSVQRLFSQNRSALAKTIAEHSRLFGKFR